VPHYAEENPYLAAREAEPRVPGFFKYGAPRGENDSLAGRNAGNLEHSPA